MLQRTARRLEEPGGILFAGRRLHFGQAMGDRGRDRAALRTVRVLRAPFPAAQEDPTAGEAQYQRALTADKPRLKIERAQGCDRAAGCNVVRSQSTARGLTGRG